MDDTTYKQWREQTPTNPGDWGSDVEQQTPTGPGDWVSDDKQQAPTNRGWGSRDEQQINANANATDTSEVLGPVDCGIGLRTPTPELFIASLGDTDIGINPTPTATSPQAAATALCPDGELYGCI